MSKTSFRLCISSPTPVHKESKKICCQRVTQHPQCYAVNESHNTHNVMLSTSHTTPTMLCCHRVTQHPQCYAVTESHNTHNVMLSTSHTTPTMLCCHRVTQHPQCYAVTESHNTHNVMLSPSHTTPTMLCPICDVSLFIIYVNDITASSNIFKFIMYADDTTLFTTMNYFENNEHPNHYINNELSKISGLY